MIRVPTPVEVRRWPVTVDIPTAGRCWGLGRDASYRLANTGGFPVPVLTLGRRLVVTRASVLAALDIEDGPSTPLASVPGPQVVAPASDVQSGAPPTGRAA